jgi:hypothetical protein
MTALERLQQRPIDHSAYGLANAAQYLQPLKPPSNALGLAFLARLQRPDPNELLMRTETVTLPRWLWERLDRGEIVWTDLRRL